MNSPMLHRHARLIALILALTLLPLATSPAGGVTPPDRQESPAPRLEQNFGQLPLYFVENRGQTDPSVAYYLLGDGTQVWFTRDGVTFALREPASAPLTPFPKTMELQEDRPTLQRGWSLKLDFVGANSAARIAAEEQQQAVVSYFKGSPAERQVGLRTYARVVYPDLWPGIDLAYYGRAGRLKYDFIVHPGADPGAIHLRYRGADGVTLNQDGRLAVSTPLGGFAEDTPVAWQDAGGQRVPVATAYRVTGESFGFDVAAYDRTQPLVIDPVVLLYCGYIGGSGAEREYGGGIAVDSSGAAYVAGATPSDEATFPVTTGPDLSQNGDLDAFVAKVNATGTALLYASYIGGSQPDDAAAIAVDDAGNAYVTGTTQSSESTFPATVGPDLTYNGGDYGDAFVAKVSPSGTSLIYAGYIGGAGSDSGHGVTVDAAGAAYVAGDTSSGEDTFPVAVGPDLTQNGSYDAFVAKVNPAGTALLYAGYIGGSDQDWASGIAVDGAGSAFITGAAYSTEATFPVAIGPDLTHNGGADAFVAKVNRTGTALVYAGYIGGSGGNSGYGIAVDSTGNAYAAGMTWGPGFPATVGPDLTYNGGMYDAFVAKVNPSGAALIYAGYIGGAEPDWGSGIAVDHDGAAYVAGYTGSDQSTFPVLGGPDLTYNDTGGPDAFVAKVRPDGTALTYAGYIGGSGWDYGNSIAVDSAGNAYVEGATKSTEATFPVTVGPDLTYNGGSYDIFVAKVSSGEGSTGRLYLPLVLRN